MFFYLLGGYILIIIIMQKYCVQCVFNNMRIWCCLNILFKVEKIVHISHYCKISTLYRHYVQIFREIMANNFQNTCCLNDHNNLQKLHIKKNAHIILMYLQSFKWFWLYSLRNYGFREFILKFIFFCKIATSYIGVAYFPSISIFFNHCPCHILSVS